MVAAVAAQLRRLERLDTELERQEAQLIEMRRRQGRSLELEGAEARVETLRAQERSASAEQRALESDLAAVEGNIARDQSRMYGGQIVDPRELASLQREIEHYTSERARIEDLLLAAMERLEGLQEQLAEASRSANLARERWETDRPALELQTEGLVDALTGMREERDTLASELDAQSLGLYQRLRTSTGHAVSTVSAGVCGWCRVAIPPKDVQHARSGTLVTCTNCSRVLYVGGAEE